MSTIAERVAAGMAFLDKHDPDWWRADAERAIDLDTLDLKETHACILGQRCPLETLAAYAGVDDPEELSSVDFGEAYYVNASRLNGGFTTRLALSEWAVSCGFNSAANAQDEFDALTAEWKRVITERRSA